MKALFIEHEYHAKTGSNNFFVEMIKEIGFTVEKIAKIDLPRNLMDYDLFIVWQDLGVYELLPKDKKIILIPMFDAATNLKVKDFSKYSDCYIINFSINLHYFTKFSGCNSFYLKYFPEWNGNEKLVKEGIFFWERTPAYGINFDIAKIISKNMNEKLTYRPHIDPHDPSFKHFNNLWMPKNEYLEMVSNHKYFLAPRNSEGIGLSYLEAMSLGCIVLALNFPTMNEYINNGKNGILLTDNNYNIKDLDYNKLYFNNKKTVIDGRTQYLKSKHILQERIIDFLTLDKPQSKKIKILPGGLSLFKFHRLLGKWINLFFQPY